MVQLTPARLAEMQAHVYPAPEVRQRENGSEEDTKLAEAYFANFLRDFRTCPCCGNPTLWAWTTTRGEGACQQCRYPLRVYHTVRTADGATEDFVVPLYYQPSKLVAVLK